MLYAWAMQTPADAVHRIGAAKKALDHLSAFDLAEQARATWPDDLQIEYESIFALVNLGATEAAAQRLARLPAARIAAANDRLRVDVQALRGRLLKEQALRARGAARTRLAAEAAAAYAALADGPDAPSYPAINAAALWQLAGNAAAARAMAGQARDRARAEPVSVWSLFTAAEAALILRDPAAADALYARGAMAAGDDMRAVASARRQLRWLLPALGLPDGAVGGPPPSSIAHWHCADPARAAAFAAALGTGKLRPPRALAIGPVLSVADLIVARALMQAGVRVELVLPCAADACRAAFGTPAAEFDAVLGAAASVSLVTDEGSPDEASLAALARRQARGLALLRGAGDAAPVWRASLGAAAHEPARVTLDDGSAEPAAPDGGERVQRALLFGDVSGFSRLTEGELVRFVEHVIGGFADATAAAGVAVDYAETAGDGLYLVLPTVAAAARCATALHGVLAPARLQAAGLPLHLKLRLSLHCGPVRRALDRVIGRQRYLGREVIRTARIEPVTPPGGTYVTEQFAAALACSGGDGARWRCDYVGVQPMAKDYGACRMYALGEVPAAEA